MMDISFVNEYLALHLQADFWSSLDADKKSAAFKMASDDVCAWLGISEIDPLRIFQVCAVSEQAVFLAEHYDELNTNRKIVSEKIDGVGTREYQLPVNPAFSPRALAFLEREGKSLDGLLNISRG
ncbi:MAG: hypothetical protein WC082_04970 [Victivallales bacterium]